LLPAAAVEIVKRPEQTCQMIDGGIHEAKEEEAVVIFNSSRNHSFDRDCGISWNHLCAHRPLLAFTG
jgi:hypothetical protein